MPWLSWIGSCRSCNVECLFITFYHFGCVGRKKCLYGRKHLSRDCKLLHSPIINKKRCVLSKTTHKAYPHPIHRCCVHFKDRKQKFPNCIYKSPKSQFVKNSFTVGVVHLLSPPRSHSLINRKKSVQLCYFPCQADCVLHSRFYTLTRRVYLLCCWH